MAPIDETLRIEVRLAIELSDAFGKAVGVLLLFLGMLQELVLDCLGVNSRGHIVVAFIAQGADDLSGERLVQQLHHGFAIALVTFSDRTVLDMLSSTLPDTLNVRNEFSACCLSCCAIHFFPPLESMHDQRGCEECD